MTSSRSLWVLACLAYNVSGFLVLPTIGVSHFHTNEQYRLASTGEGVSDKPDLLEYFDPLASPHSYPDGIGPGKAVGTNSAPTMTKEDSTAEAGAPASTETDPLVVCETPKVLGVLLMDHGSRNPSSNERLDRLAELYQMTLEDSSPKYKVIVKPAHMEIATPTIPDGLQALLEAGVDEIVCHPYFLSPGRHVTTDIPSIVNQAIQDLNIEIPISTTDPVGSNTQLMIGAIHSLIRETSMVLRDCKN
eukprot:Nitzschia sp. Nitz4//scaffold123_size70294//9255//9995//NITZ4_005920-RA/size70294-processed-gene-0.3-mRNA-1//1//CDS//3329534461//6948//frame0